MDMTYINNIGSFISEQDQDTLLKKTIGILGCGGNGGYVIEFLARLGIKKLVFFDGDTYSVNNLNRQTECYLNTLGEYKAEIIAKQIHFINTKLQIEYYTRNATPKDIDILKQCDIVVNCADNVNIFLLKLLIAKKIPVVQESNLDNGSFVVILKDNFNELEKIYSQSSEKKISQPAYLCALTAALACNETIKFLLNRPYASDYELRLNILNNQIFRLKSF